MSAEKKSKEQRNQPSYLIWRGGLLAKLALSRLPNIKITEQPLEGRYDLSATTADNFTFLVEVKVLSSIRENIRDIEAIEKLRWQIPSAFLREAKSAQHPVVLFLFDVDTGHGRFLRTDSLELKTTSARLQTVRLPRTNTITSESLYRMLLELHPAPEQASRPANAQRVVIFDTNAYRQFTTNLLLDDVRAATRKLCELEERAGWFVLAHPIVVWELIAHLKKTSDPAYNHCINALVSLGMHSASREREDGSINLIADALSLICRELFGRMPSGYEQGLQNLGTLITYIVQNAPIITDPVAQLNISNLSIGMAAKEDKWLRGMEEVLDRVSPDMAKAVFGVQNDLVALKKVRRVFASEDFMNMMATHIVISNAAEVGVFGLTSEEIQHKAQLIRKMFPVPFHLASALLQKLATVHPPQLANAKKRRWNFVWDIMISFVLGRGTIGEAPVYLVTGDSEIVAAATAAGVHDRVLSLEKYLQSVGMT